MLVTIQKEEEERRRDALVAIEEAVILHDEVQEVCGFLLRRWVGLLTCETRVDVADGGTERVILLYAKQAGLVAKAHARNHLAALIVVKDVGTSRTLWTTECLVVVVVQQVERGRVAADDVERLAGGEVPLGKTRHYVDHLT